MTCHYHKHDFVPSVFVPVSIYIHNPARIKTISGPTRVVLTLCLYPLLTLTHTHTKHKHTNSITAKKRVATMNGNFYGHHHSRVTVNAGTPGGIGSPTNIAINGVRPNGTDNGNTAVLGPTFVHKYFER